MSVTTERSVYGKPAERDRRMAQHLNDQSERLSERLTRIKDGRKFTALTQTHISGFKRVGGVTSTLRWNSLPAA
jgi:hypothetical protein